MELRAWLIDYSHDVINCDIVACQKHKWACERFLDDLEREGSDDFPYLFNEEKALHFLEWMTLFKHTKGPLAGEHIDPAPIQIFVFGNIYGWIHKDTEARRFTHAYWQVARKNTKSQSLAIVGAYELMAMGEQFSEVYCAATKKDQAKIVYDETKAIMSRSDFLQDKFKEAYSRIEHPKSGSFMRALSKEDRRTGDGYNPQCGIIDEYHGHETSEIYDVIDSGMGARKQPLLMIITTAGFNLHYPCYSVEYKLISRIVDPNDDQTDDTYFVMVNELDKDDDIKDESVWEKANPIAASHESGINRIRNALNKALGAPEKMKNFMTKHMNVWVDAKDDAFMSKDKWKAAKRAKRDDLMQYPCFVGGDLSATTDITSLGMVFVIGPGQYHIKQHSFLPEDRLQERIKSDKVPFDLWKEQGYLETTPGSVVDYNYIEQYIYRMRSQGYNIMEFDYDKWNASHLAQNIENNGVTTVEIPQTISHLTNPTKQFRAEVYKGNLTHEDDPLLNWAIGNAIQKQDAQENIMLDKSKSTERIDPAAAIINGFARAMHHGSIDVSSHFLKNWSL